MVILLFLIVFIGFIHFIFLFIKMLKENPINFDYSKDGLKNNIENIRKNKIKTLKLRLKPFLILSIYLISTLMFLLLIKLLGFLSK
jgi:hypothetical protein